jgi:hypothetical protein
LHAATERMCNCLMKTPIVRPICGVDQFIISSYQLDDGTCILNNVFIYWCCVTEQISAVAARQWGQRVPAAMWKTPWTET